MVCFYFAEGWADLMENKISKGETVSSCAKSTLNLLLDNYPDKEFNLTVFMYNYVVSILCHCWEYGEELRIWHNLDVQIDNEGEIANKNGNIINSSVMRINGSQ